MRVRVVAAGKNSDGRRFREACETVLINAHGGLLCLNQPASAWMQCSSSQTRSRRKNRNAASSLGDVTDKGQRIGVEFLTLHRISGALTSFPPIGPLHPPPSARIRAIIYLTNQAVSPIPRAVWGVSRFDDSAHRLIWR